MSKHFNCNDIIECLKTKIANGESVITESDLVRELQELSPITEVVHNNEEDTSLLEAIYVNMDKVLEG